MSRKKFTSVLSYEDACAKAESILENMELNEKIEYIGGHNYFFIKGVEKHNLPKLYLADATQGVHLRNDLDGQLEKSTSFPAPIALASTWNTELAYEYAQSVGEECRAGDIAVLLGPGMNIYRNSQNGRNFEYFGEDPFLAARFIENYVSGMQNTGTIATLKHFMCNNTDYYRRTSNSIVDERTLHEIYLPAFKAGIDAGAMAIMTSYNQINGEWAGQSSYVINDVLRTQLGFKWLVMTDWWSIWNPEKAIASGLDLDMPGHGRKSPTDIEDFNNPFLRTNAKTLIEQGKVKEEDIHRMARNVIATSLAMGLDTRAVKDDSFLSTFDSHVQVALETARQGTVLLKNRNAILPLSKDADLHILLSGMFVDKNAHGGGAADVQGYDVLTLKTALKDEFGTALSHVDSPSDAQISKASHVILSIGTLDSEGWDSPFELPQAVNDLITRFTNLNSNVIVVMNSGRGVGMTPWIDSVAALLYGWYPGQIGNKAIAEIISGVCNPSGKLPISIEKHFEDSPAYPYISEELGFYEGWKNDFLIDLPIQDIHYNEGVFVGYRWFQKQLIEPLFPFGFGLSYAQFSYSNIHITKQENSVFVEFEIQNISDVQGSEICQVYVQDIECSVERPTLELKGFTRVLLQARETKKVRVELKRNDFAFYDIHTQTWVVEPGEFKIYVGSSSADLHLSKVFEI